MVDRPIIIRRYRKSHPRPHGGVWKIAYADFVTAMMALFLLMWLINVSTEETKKGISEYFSTSLVSIKSSSVGTGVIEGEVSATKSGNSDQEEVTDANNIYNSYNSNIPTKEDQHITQMLIFPSEFAASKTGDKETDHKITTSESNKPSVEHSVKRQDEISENTKIDNKQYSKGINKTLEKEQESEKIAVKKLQQKEVHQKIEDNIKTAFNSLQEVEKFKHNLIIELKNEGIRIQIVDSPDHEMFKSGSPIPAKFTEKIIKALGGIITKLPNKIEITGHTDSRPYQKKGYGNWELSSDRAHSTRRILEESGVKSNLFVEVNGRADKDPLNKNNSKAPENRRVSITILYAESEEQEKKPIESASETQNQKNSNNKIPKIIL